MRIENTFNLFGCYIVNNTVKNTDRGKEEKRWKGKTRMQKTKTKKEY